MCRASVTQVSVGHCCPLALCPVWWHLNDVTFNTLTSFHSKPLVSPKGGHQKRPALCLRMGSLSITTVVETPNLVMCVMKDEEKPWLCREGDGRNCEKFTKRWDSDIQKCGDDVCETLAVNLSGLQHKHLHNVSIQRSWDAASLLCHCKCMREVKQRVDHK